MPILFRIRKLFTTIKEFVLPFASLDKDKTLAKDLLINEAKQILIEQYLNNYLSS